MPIGMVDVFRGWLRDRSAIVVVAGGESKTFALQNAVCQGVVWAAYLWNAFFGDNASAIENHGFIAVVFADYRNTGKSYKKQIWNIMLSDENDE